MSSQLFNKTLLQSLTGQERIAVLGSDGKIKNVLSSVLLGQIFNLEQLGNSCLNYPVQTTKDCQTNETVELPLQIADVLLVMETKICELINNVGQLLQNGCGCSESELIEMLVYNEFLGESAEWNTTEVSGGQNIYLDSVNKPYIQDKSIELKESNPNLLSEIFFTNDTNINVSLLKSLKFFIDTEDSPANIRMKLVFFQDNLEVSEVIYINEGTFGFSNNNIGYNEVIVPIQQSIFTGSTFNKIYLSFDSVNGQPLDKIYIDYIRIFLQNNVSTNINPTVNAGANLAIQLPTNSASLNAIGNDVDGTIETYFWEKISGGNAVITNPNLANTTVTGLVEGVYVFKCTVVDNQGGIGVDVKVIIVNASGALTPPTADAGVDININQPTSTANLNGSGSSDGDGSIVSYEWNQISGTPVTITSPNSANTSVTGLNALGTYVFELTVTDNDGLTATDTISVIVEEEQEVAQIIDIYLGDCGNPQFENSTKVYVSELPSNIAQDIVNINNGDILYEDAGLTTPFDGGNEKYLYKGFNGNDIPYEVLTVANNGVVSGHEVCNRIIDYSFNYDSSSASQSDTLFPLDLPTLTSGYTGTFSKIRILTLPDTGELGIQGTTITTVPTEVTQAMIDNGVLDFWADDTNGLGNHGDYVTEFNYVIVDATGNDADYVTIRLNANDIVT